MFGIMNDSYGQDILHLRQQAGISLRELARLADMSPASLSAIEKGTSSPTLATLHKLLRALGTNFADFFADARVNSTQLVFERVDMRHMADAARKYVLAFPKRSDIRFQIIDEDISPAEADNEWEVHDVDVGGIVVEGGPARLEIETRQGCLIYSGSAFYIPAGMKHRLVNCGIVPLRLITVYHPPRY